MNTLPLFIIGILFIILNIYWNKNLYQRKVELEKKERNFWLTGELNIYERLGSALESIENGLGEWQSVTETYSPEWMIPFKQAQEEIKELIHDLEVIGE